MNDAVIVGGGVIGCSIALSLANSGLKVAVVERGRVGCEASRAAAGMLSPQTEAQKPGPFFDLCLKSRSMYHQFAAELTELSGIDVEYRHEGSLCLISDEKELSPSGQWWSWQQDAGLEVEVISAETARQMEPSITQSALGAVFIPGDHQIENRLLMDALLIAMKRAGVELLEGQNIERILVEAGRSIGVAGGGIQFHAGTVIVAAGCWSSQLLEKLGLRLELTPARGQMLALGSTTSSPVNHTLHSNKCYLIPRSDGRILVGATVEYVGFHKAVTAGGIRSLLDAAIELVPVLENFDLTETWSGLRPDTPDHMPVLGPSGVDNLLIATGHFRNGVLLAPVTAELITQEVIQGRPSEELIPYSISRFERGGETKRAGSG